MNTTIAILGSVGLISIVSFVGVFALPLREKQAKGIFNFFISLAVGALLGDVFLHMIPESFSGGGDPVHTSLFLLLGMGIFFVLEKVLRWNHHAPEESQEHTSDMHTPQGPAHLGKLVLVSDGMHNFIDGLVVGVSYLVSIEVGIATTLAIILHEIPHEVGDFLVLLYAGYKRTTALLYNFLSALTALAGAAVVLLIGPTSEYLLNAALPLAAGAFIYIAASDLIPELHKSHPMKSALFYQIVGISIGVLAVYILLFLE